MAVGGGQGGTEMFLKNFKVVAEQLLKLWGLVFSGLETGANELQFFFRPTIFL